MSETKERKFVSPVSLLPRHKFLWLRRKFRKMHVPKEPTSNAVEIMRRRYIKTWRDRFWLRWYWIVARWEIWWYNDRSRD